MTRSTRGLRVNGKGGVGQELSGYTQQVRNGCTRLEDGEGRMGPLELLGAAFQPASEEQLDNLTKLGYADTYDWLRSL